MDPARDGSASLGEASEVVLPDALLLEAAKETLDDSVLLGRVRRDELLAQPVIAAGGAEATALEDEAVVAAHHRRLSVGAQRAEPRDACLLQRTLGLLGTRTKREFVADDLAVVAID